MSDTLIPEIQDPKTPTSPEGEQLPATQTPPSGEPKLYAGKFKSVEDLEKGYKSSTKEYGDLKAKIPTVPENYDLKFVESDSLKDVLKTDDPLLTKMLPVFKEAGMSQTQMEGVISKFYGLARDVIPKYDQAEEMKKLGESATEITHKLAEVAMGIKDENDRKVFKSMCMTAEECKVMASVLKLTGEKSIPDGRSSSPQVGKTVAEAQEAVDKFSHANRARIGADPEITKEYTRLMQDLVIAKDPSLAKERKS